MAIVVSKKGVKVKANGKYYSFDEVIQGLTDSEEKRLTEGGVCEYAPSSVVSSDIDLKPLEKTNTAAKANKTSGSKETKEDSKQTDDTEDSKEAGPDTFHPLA